MIQAQGVQVCTGDGEQAGWVSLVYCLALGPAIEELRFGFANDMVAPLARTQNVSSVNSEGQV